MDLKITKFDMSSMKDDKVIVLIGKRETGKSVLVKDLLYLKVHIGLKNLHISSLSSDTMHQRYPRQHFWSNLWHILIKP